ncbi:MAG: DUF167 domain-containing protein [Gallionella sp.]
MSWYRPHADGLVLTLHVQPGAKKTQVIGLHGDALKIKLAAPPIEGRANDALRRFIADTFDVPLRNVEFKQGEQSRHKVLVVQGTALIARTLWSGDESGNAS